MTSHAAASLIDRVRAGPHKSAATNHLVALLRQDAAHFRGLSPGEVEAARGGLLAELAGHDLTAEALAVIREELRTSSSPAILAGAARALRHMHDTADGWRSLLTAAAERIALNDRAVGPAAGNHDRRTATAEIADTLAALDLPAPPCCGGGHTTPEAGARAQHRASLDPGRLGRIIAEDQSGARRSLQELLCQRTTVLAFFYTRCMNPLKCSLTVTRLAALARANIAGDEAAAPDVLAMSYDPLFDTPARLSEYGLARGFPFGERARMARCIRGWSALRAMLGLQVGYGPATVNDHARELFVISPIGEAVSLDCEALAEPSTLIAKAR